MTTATEQFFRIIGGDGDQRFLKASVILKRTNADWFPGKIPELARAVLFVVFGGPYAGQYVALTSRVARPLEEQLRAGHASVIVHQIKNPTSSFGESKSDSLSIGMAVIEAVRETA